MGLIKLPDTKTYWLTVSCKVTSTWPSLWSSDQSCWLKIQRSGFDSRRYQILWEVVGLERGPPNLVSITEELLERKSIGSGLEKREFSHGDSSRWPCGTLYPQKLALTWQTSGGRSDGIVRSQTQATEFVFVFYYNSTRVVVLLQLFTDFPESRCCSRITWRDSVAK
jgi:hypothetical protein